MNNADEMMTAQGAAINGVYHPPVRPWNGHAEDVLWTETGGQPRTSVPLWPTYCIWAIVAVALGAWAAWH